MDTFKRKLERTKSMIVTLISDRSVEPSVTLEALEELQDTIGVWIEALENDIRNAT